MNVKKVNAADSLQIWTIHHAVKKTDSEFCDTQSVWQLSISQTDIWVCFQIEWQ